MRNKMWTVFSFSLSFRDATLVIPAFSAFLAIDALYTQSRLRRSCPKWHFTFATRSRKMLLENVWNYWALRTL